MHKYHILIIRSGMGEVDYLLLIRIGMKSQSVKNLVIDNFLVLRISNFNSGGFF